MNNQKYSIYHEWKYPFVPRKDNQCRELLTKRIGKSRFVYSYKIIKVIRDWSPVCKNCSVVMWKEPLTGNLAEYTKPSPKKNLCLKCYQKENEIINH